MKALGMSSRRVFVLFSIEAVLIGFLGQSSGCRRCRSNRQIVNAIGKAHFPKNLPGLRLSPSR